MKTIEPTDRLLSSFGGSPSPATAPDGGPALEPAPVRLPMINPISRCSLGPCRNYHRLVTRLDAQDPLAGVGVLYVTTTHTCYPAPGIEVDLGGTPVKECSRWDPMAARERADQARLEQNFASGESQQSELAEFRASWEGVSTLNTTE